MLRLAPTISPKAAGLGEAGQRSPAPVAELPSSTDLHPLNSARSHDRAVLKVAFQPLRLLRPGWDVPRVDVDAGNLHIAA